MRIDVTRAEFECIVNALKHVDLKSERKLRAQLGQRLDWQLHPSKAPDSDGWAPMKPIPIRSSWPSGHIKASKKRNWSIDSHPKPPKPKPPTADEIIASI